MASSSSSPFNKEWTYHVFLSFRGEDTRWGFTKNLYEALSEKGIKTFFDDYALEKGEVIGPTLEKAIQESRIALLIFSKDYAASRFCLEELAMIMECSKKGMWVVPVFYLMEPSDVRYLKGSYEGALEKHANRSGEEKIQKWKLALQNAADLSGHTYKQGMYERNFIAEIAQSVYKKICSLLEEDEIQQPKPRFMHREEADTVASYNKIPKEEKILGIDGKSVHVHHYFMKHDAENKEQIKKFGDPFSVVIHKDDRLTDIKKRVQRRLRIPYDEISKLKFAIVSIDRVDDLKDIKYPDSAFNRFKSGNLYGKWKQYLGLEHVEDVAP